MDQFFVSITIFLVLCAGAGIWQHRTRRVREAITAQVDQTIMATAEIAQRRHVERFGRASTDLTHTYPPPMGTPKLVLVEDSKKVSNS